MADYLLNNGAQIDLKDNEGWNALDIAVIKMNYDAALFAKKRGLQLRSKEIYETQLWRKYDLDLFLEYLEEQKLEVNDEIFFASIKSKFQINYGFDIDLG